MLIEAHIFFAICSIFFVLTNLMQQFHTKPEDASLFNIPVNIQPEKFCFSVQPLAQTQPGL